MSRLIIFDDDTARTWEPFSLTRPVGELLFGVMTLRARAERVVGTACSAHIAAGLLEGFDEPDAPPVAAPGEIVNDAPRLFLLSRFVPAWQVGDRPEFTSEGPIADPDGNVIGWYAPSGAPTPPESFFRDPAATGASGHRLEGSLLRYPWDLVVRNPEQITSDIRALFPPPVGTRLPKGVFHWGEHPLIVDATATVEPGSAFDTSGGPIWLDRESEVRAFTRLAGPAYVGQGSIVTGGPVEAVSLGPMCRVRGELAESVCVGYTNKQHDGHIGHAYLGRWVNLGAETTNSDLKNNYGSIRIWTPNGTLDSGLIKLGTLIGDHVKTGIGLLLNTGTVVGAGSNLFGGAMPPTYVPPFSWGTGDDLVEFRLDRFLEVAERVMGRRGVQLSPSARGQLERAWHHSRSSPERDGSKGAS